MKKLSLLTAGALGALLVASAASAQSTNERVEVTAPRVQYAPRESTIGAPIENVSMSEHVRYDDLNLRTASGARTLEQRVRYTAQAICNRLDHLYPITEQGSPPCIQGAIATGMQHADAAIQHVRYVAYLDDKRRMASLDKSKKEKQHVAARENTKKKTHAA